MAKVGLNFAVMGLAASGAAATIGYATFVQPLAENPGNQGNWDIGFTEAIKSEVHGNAKEINPVTYNSNSANFNIHLAGNGDKISYDFTVENKGTLKAKVQNITILPENNSSDFVLVKVSGLEAGDILDTKAKAELQVDVSYNNNRVTESTNLEKNIKVIVNYVQA